MTEKYIYRGPKGVKFTITPIGPMEINAPSNFYPECEIKTVTTESLFRKIDGLECKLEQAKDIIQKLCERLALPNHATDEQLPDLIAGNNYEILQAQQFLKELKDAE